MAWKVEKVRKNIFGTFHKISSFCGKEFFAPELTIYYCQKSLFMYQKRSAGRNDGFGKNDEFKPLASLPS